MPNRNRSAAARVGSKEGATFYFTSEPGAKTVVQLGKDPKRPASGLIVDEILHRVSQKTTEPQGQSLRESMGFGDWVSRFSFEK